MDCSNSRHDTGHFLSLRLRHTFGNEKMNACSEFDSRKGCLFPRVLFIRLKRLTDYFMLLLAKVMVCVSATVIIVH